MPKPPHPSPLGLIRDCGHYSFLGFRGMHLPPRLTSGGRQHPWRFSVQCQRKPATSSATRSGPLSIEHNVTVLHIQDIQGVTKLHRAIWPRARAVTLASPEEGIRRDVNFCGSSLSGRTHNCHSNTPHKTGHRAFKYAASSGDMPTTNIVAKRPH